jgi:hypothetical protein
MNILGRIFILFLSDRQAYYAEKDFSALWSCILWEMNIFICRYIKVIILGI